MEGGIDSLLNRHARWGETLEEMEEMEVKCRMKE